LIGLLLEFGVGLLVDVRRFPASRRHPQFGKEQLSRSLSEAGIGYLHEPDLGGHRVAGVDSPNTDYMDSASFQGALRRLLERAAGMRVVVMCAEADPRRCHRQLLADALVAKGAEVEHILSPGRSEAHRLHAGARVLAGGRIVYDARRQLSLMPDGSRE
jgi:uncharacterized protein (DUF488 family)